VWLSRDHKASAHHERERIASAGGTVTDGRVEGLEPSRTLGDFDVKQNVNRGVISIEPEVRRHQLGTDAEVSQAVIVCCSDGVWDVLSGNDICNLIVARKEIAKLQWAMAGLSGLEANTNDKEVLRLLAEDFVQFSIAKGSRDDCTAIVSFVSVPPCVITGPSGHLVRNVSL
jgi:serine/threonine protein phosphatase PrpC